MSLPQSSGGTAFQPREISPGHQSRIQASEEAIRSLPSCFSPCGEEEGAKLRQDYKDAYLRIIEYYCQGNELASGDEFVFTITGTNEVWRGIFEEMIKMAEELKGYPISDHCGIQASHNTGERPKEINEGIWLDQKCSL